jgi:hypothetical protein
LPRGFKTTFKTGQKTFKASSIIENIDSRFRRCGSQKAGNLEEPPPNSNLDKSKLVFSTERRRKSLKLSGLRALKGPKEKKPIIFKTVRVP